MKFDQDQQLPDFKFDPDQIKRVLMNLLDNAVAAVQDQPEPRVAVRTQYDSLLKLVRVSVLDNGVGIPDADRDRVFEPYFSTKESGTGLGLAIVRRIVEDHNGFIRALANDPRGTKLIIELPVAELDNHPVMRLPVETLTMGPVNGENIDGEKEEMNEKAALRILVVDDEAPIRQVLSESLSDEGYTVKTARSGEEGLRVIEEMRPQIVLLDIWMPGSIDGIEVLNQAKKKYPGTEFIIMSGHGNIETAVKAVKFGAWDFVEKPLSIDRVLILINNITFFQSERGEKNALLNRLRRNIAIIGESAAIVNLKQMIARVASSSSSWVLITGENGTGKELVAQNIHYLESAGRQTVRRSELRRDP